VRPIRKGAQPSALTTFLASHSHATVDWDAFGRHHKPVKKAVKSALVQEQGNICCYCEREIGEAGPPPDAHIEHLHPKSAHPHLTYAWGNLLASCEDDKHRGETPESCGHRKHNQSLSLHPLVPACDTHLTFGSDGSVRAARNLPTAQTRAAEHAIETLGLDTSRPKILRTAAIRAIVDVLPPPEDPSYDSELQTEIARIANPDANGRWTPFVTALLQVLGRL
jgi:uncharacterized protein (TIGR02646 family)